MSQILFVYGTLQRGQRNHWRLMGSKFLGRANVDGRLYQFPLFNFPILRRDALGRVQGELYQVDSQVLAVQDHFEKWYKRVKVLAYPPHAERLAAGAKPISCWVYEGLNILPIRLARRLPDGRWPAL